MTVLEICQMANELNVVLIDDKEDRQVNRSIIVEASEMLRACADEISYLRLRLFSDDPHI